MIRIQSHNKKYGLINILISDRAKTEKDHHGLHSSTLTFLCPYSILIPLDRGYFYQKHNLPWPTKNY